MAHPSPSPARRSLYAALAASVLACATLDAVTLDELLNDPKLTPKRFADYFGNFAYEYAVEVQTPAEFLGSQRGDCDDYAILADYVLKRKGFQTRLIHVRMVGRVAHAVCYVTESRAYVDYNNRHYFINLQRCAPTIRAIATAVADSFEANWTSASEFTYEYEENKKHFGATVVKTDSPSRDPDSVNP